MPSFSYPFIRCAASAWAWGARGETLSPSVTRQVPVYLLNLTSSHSFILQPHGLLFLKYTRQVPSQGHWHSDNCMASLLINPCLCSDDTCSQRTSPLALQDLLTYFLVLDSGHAHPVPLTSLGTAKTWPLWSAAGHIQRHWLNEEMVWPCLGQSSHLLLQDVYSRRAGGERG